MQILVDADSCPRAAREMILRFSSRLGVKSVFAANRPIPGLTEPVEGHKQATPETAIFELCPPGEGAADRRILKLAKSGDLAITRDLPLAEQLVDAGVTVLDDRGRAFTKENIREYRSIRDFTVGLANNGLDFDRTPSYGKKELSLLANSLDRELSRLSRAAVGI
jgi:uncharacterized protein